MAHEVEIIEGFTLAAHSDEGIIAIGQGDDYWVLVGTDYLEAADSELSRAYDEALN